MGIAVSESYLSSVYTNIKDVSAVTVSLKNQYTSVWEPRLW